jgi:hypothetical protein
MQKQLQQLIEWHEAFEVPYRKQFSLGIDESLVRLRKRIMVEEVTEWATAAEYEQLIENRAKELADILYTVFGTIITEGLQDVIERVFDEVHQSNMSKMGEDGKPFKRADGKVLKGPNYREPNLDFLIAHPVNNGGYHEE